MLEPQGLTDRMKHLFPGTLGIRFLEIEKERVRASLSVEERLCTTPGILHGGAVMGFADTLGAVATFVNLAPGSSTTTIESKTNFLAAGRSGTTIEGDCTPLHRGRRTMVWQTRVLAPEGRTIALVTQTQAVLEGRQQPAEVLASLFAGKSIAEQEQLLELLERAGAGLYRQLAAGEADAVVREELLRAADREEANAAALQRILAKT